MAKLDEILAQFDYDLASISESKLAYLFETIAHFNPYFVPTLSLRALLKPYDTEMLAMLGSLSEAEQQLLLIKVNIYQGIYVPLIHAFSSFVLELMKNGKIPNAFVIPPRDPIPIYFAMWAQANASGTFLNMVNPAMNRTIAGVKNNQAAAVNQMDKLFPEYVKQELAKLGHPNVIVEIEPGIYSTTSLLIAEFMNQNGHPVTYVPIKIYGRGPNISFIHGLLTNGQEYIAEVAEQDPAVAELAEKCMVILDTIEEFGAQNATSSPKKLISTSGQIQPDYVMNDTFAQCLAGLTNACIINGAQKYLALDSGILTELATNIVMNVDQLIAFANEGIPLVFREPIPAMDDKESHYSALRDASERGIINYQLLNCEA